MAVQALGWLGWEANPLLSPQTGLVGLKLAERLLLVAAVLAWTLTFRPDGLALAATVSGWEQSSTPCLGWCFQGSGTEEKPRLNRTIGRSPCVSMPACFISFGNDWQEGLNTTRYTS